MRAGESAVSDSVLMRNEQNCDDGGEWRKRVERSDGEDGDYMRGGRRVAVKQSN